MDMFDLSGRVAVITGGNSGIGLSMARGLVKAGANVAIWARNAEKNAAAVKELDALGSGKAAAFACDVASEPDIEAAMDKTLSEFGRVDVAFANAGIACNAIAGLHHDHLFVQWDRREEALALLEKLSLDASR